jgi:hypothetical protein
MKGKQPFFFLSLKRNKKYNSETKRKEKYGKRKEAKGLCKIFANTCKTKAKRIPFHFVLL